MQTPNTFVLTLSLVSPAFEGGKRGPEISRLLREAAQYIEIEHTEVILQDSNGEIAGQAEFTHE